MSVQERVFQATAKLFNTSNTHRHTIKSRRWRETVFVAATSDGDNDGGNDGDDDDDDKRMYRDDKKRVYRDSDYDSSTATTLFHFGFFNRQFHTITGD